MERLFAPGHFVVVALMAIRLIGLLATLFRVVNKLNGCGAPFIEAFALAPVIRLYAACLNKSYV